jgi:hypothetical protein
MINRFLAAVDRKHQSPRLANLSYHFNPSTIMPTQTALSDIRNLEPGIRHPVPAVDPQSSTFFSTFWVFAFRLKTLD